MKRKWLCALLCLAATVMLFAVTASAETYGGLTYTVSDGKVTITGCSTTASGALVIPAQIEGYPVTSIGYRAFYECSGLTSIEIPSSVTSIGYAAFAGCWGLASITIPSSVTSIEHRAFAGCSGLTSIEIPSSVTSIGSYAFYNCSGLTSIEIPSGVTSIGDRAFYNCSGLTSIEIWNADCHIYDHSNTIPTGATIYGYAGSTAQAYAQTYGLGFVAFPESPLSLSGVYTDGNGKLRFVTQVTTTAGDPDIEYFGTYIVPLSYFTEHELTAVGEEQLGVGRVKYMQNIASGSSFAADLTSIPSAAYDAPIFAWSFIKFQGIDTVYVETLGVFTVNGATLVKGGF